MKNYLKAIIYLITITVIFSQQPCILGEVYVSEAANAGDPEDYIEIYNSGTNTCDLIGFQLDDSEELEDFVFQSVILAPGAYWLGYSNDDNSFNSGLNNSGDMIAFADPSGNMLIVTLQHSMQSDDGIELSQSFGADGFGCYTFPTPGNFNSECVEFNYGCTDPDANNYNENSDIDDGSCEYSISSCILGEVYVSEAANAGDPEDFIEIHNSGDNECTLYGFKLDDSENLEDFTFENVVLLPDEYWIGFEDEDNSFSSGLSGDGDIIVFADLDGNFTVTTLQQSVQTSDGIELSQSFGVNGNGCYTLPSPGETNNDCVDSELATLSDSFSSKFMLSSAYPNPFNPTTYISYEIYRLTDLFIGVYNINGQLVTTLYSGQQNPGKYSIYWDAKNFSSGTYFVKMTSNSYTVTQKIQLVK